jgi:cobalamin biosynthesis protein CobT
MNNQIFQESEKKIITMTNSDDDEQEEESDDEEQRKSDNEEQRESDDEEQGESDDEEQRESDHEQQGESDDEEEENNNEEQEYEDELNYKKQILKSFCNYLQVIIKSIDDKKHNKKIINELYYIVNIYYKNNKDLDIVKYFNTNQVNLKKKENNIFESFINKTIDINKRLIKEPDISNSILYLNNFITNSIFF